MMEIAKILQFKTDDTDMLGMIVANNIDVVVENRKCVSEKQFDKLVSELLDWYKFKLKQLIDED